MDLERHAQAAAQNRGRHAGKKGQNDPAAAHKTFIVRPVVRLLKVQNRAAMYTETASCSRLRFAQSINAILVR
jgi:hypothetical protein